MPSYLSSEQITLSSGTATITIPAACEGVVIGFAAGDGGASNTWSAFTLNSASPDSETTLAQGANVSGGWPVAVCYWHNPSTGSQTLAATEPASAFARVIIAVYLDDCGATADDADVDHDVSSTASVTLTGMSGFAVRFDVEYGADPGTPTGYTSASLDSGDLSRMRASYRSDASASEAMTTDGGDQNAVMGIGIPAAAAAGGVLIHRGTSGGMQTLTGGTNA